MSAPSLPVIRRPLLQGFLAYGRFYIRKHFHAVRLARADRPLIGEQEPLLVYMNHPSWWDPMVALHLAYRFFPGRDHYGPIDGEALARYPLLGHLGLVGIEPGTPAGARRFLRLGGRAVDGGDRAFWVTAQGTFADARRRPPGLRPGLGHLAERMDRGVVLPMAIEYTWWEERLPEVLVRFGVPVRIQDEWERSTEEWNGLFEDRLAGAQDLLAEDAAARKADRFEIVLGGRAGVGGIYDLGRRLKALASGETFRPEHGRADG